MAADKSASSTGRSAEAASGSAAAAKADATANLSAALSQLSVGNGAGSLPELDEQTARRCVLAFAPSGRGGQPQGPAKQDAAQEMTRAAAMMTVARHLSMTQAPGAGVPAAENSASARSDPAASAAATLAPILAELLHGDGASPAAAVAGNRRTAYRFLASLFALSAPLGSAVVQDVQVSELRSDGVKDGALLLQPLSGAGATDKAAAAEADVAADWLELLSTGLSAGSASGFRAQLLGSAQEKADTLRAVLEHYIDEGELALSPSNAAGAGPDAAASATHTATARATLYALLVRLKLSRNVGAQKAAAQQLLPTPPTKPPSQSNAAQSAAEDEQAFELCCALFPSVSAAVSASAGTGSSGAGLRGPPPAAAELLFPLLELLSLLVLSAGSARKTAIATARSPASLLPFLASLTPLLARSRAALFPTRAAGAPAPAPSMYEMDSLLSHSGAPLLATGASAAARSDTSVQYLLLSIISALARYPPQLNAEQKQMQRLRRLALAKQRAAAAAAADRGKGGDAVDASADAEVPDEEAPAAVDARCKALVEAGITPLLVAITFAGGAARGLAAAGGDASSTALNPSPAVRSQLADVWLALVTPQDKLVRGALAQQGGSRAILALSGDGSGDAPDSAGAHDDDDSMDAASQATSTRATQALAKLLITANPVLVFTPAQLQSASAALCRQLWLSARANKLQLFEATMALTNIASAGPEHALAIASASVRVPHAAAPNGAAASGGASASDAKQANGAKAETRILREELDARIMIEDNRMLRRAYVELLCNLLVDPATHQYWVGQEAQQQQQPQAAGSAAAQGRMEKVKRRLHLLVAFCAPLGQAAEASQGSGAQQSSQSETGLPLRLAASGSLATLVSTPLACAMMLSLKPSTLNILARLISPGTAHASSDSEQGTGPIDEASRFSEVADDETDDGSTLVDGASNRAASEAGDDDFDEEAEEEAEQADLASSPQGPAHARASLALRGITVLHCLAQYLTWLVSTPSPQAALAIGTDGAHAAEQARRALRQSGLVTAAREVAMHSARAVSEAQQQLARGVRLPPAQGEVLAMQSEIAKLALESLRAMQACGISVA